MAGGAVSGSIAALPVRLMIGTDGIVRLLAELGSGRFLAREGGKAAGPTGRLSPEMDPACNFGAELL